MRLTASLAWTYRQAEAKCRDVGTRTPDLCRVNAGISSTHNNFPRLLGTAEDLIIPSGRTHLGLAIGLKNLCPNRTQDCWRGKGSNNMRGNVHIPLCSLLA